MGMSSQYIFQYPTTGRWVCDAAAGMLTALEEELSVPYHGSLGL